MAKQYASIIIDISHENVDRVFQYRIPEALSCEIRIGTQVCVPFGSGNRLRKGYVVEITSKADYDPERMKEIASLVPGGINANSRLIELAWWMKERYGSTMSQALKTVLPVKKKIRARNRQVVEKLVGEKTHCADAPVLNPWQQEIVDSFCADYDEKIYTPFLLHGVTGSGKTEVYMAMLEHVLASGRQAIVLIPEIALTYQTVMRFYQRFGEQVCVMHSRLAAGERCEQFSRAETGKAGVMIGARSALFAPFPDLGLIILDEEHESAYKSESSPRYHAREVAQKLASLCGASLVLGSATPSLESYEKAQTGLYRLARLDQRAVPGSILPAVEIIDLRQELREGNRSIFSRRLQQEMTKRLGQGEQVMLFMNRRGYANFISCRSCGTAIRCPHCDVSLTYHRGSRLVCHYCGYTKDLPNACPECGSPYLAGFGTGTQKIEEMTAELFPQARILRMDLDTTSRKGEHEAILAAFARHEADILIGTQMIVKGHDFPDVTLVGILAADASLYAPDFRSAERTFQLLVQAAGRAGRGKKQGLTLIQTYQPKHYAVQAAACQDYGKFYQEEMKFRQMLHYPPAGHMLEIQIAGEDESLASHMAEQICLAVERNFGRETQVIGPVPAPVYKIHDIYRKILYLKQENYDILIRIQKYVQQRWDETERCRQLTIQYDFT